MWDEQGEEKDNEIYCAKVECFCVCVCVFVSSSCLFHCLPVALD